MAAPDRASQLVTAALDQLSAALAAGHSVALSAFLKTMARFHRYSWGNQLLIHSQRPDATRVAGFRAWLALGRAVRRGEKGIAILAPLVRKNLVVDADEREDTDRRIVGFRTAYVFDVSQTDGDALPEIARPSGDPGEAIRRLEELVAARGIILEYVASVPGAPGALGASFGGRLAVRQHLPPAEAFTTLLHEVAHELLHRDPSVGRLSHGVRELEADAVAGVVAHALGMDALTATSDYIQLHQGSAELLGASLGRITRVASELLASVAVDDSRAARLA